LRASFVSLRRSLGFCAGQISARIHFCRRLSFACFDSPRSSAPARQGAGPLVLPFFPFSCGWVFSIPLAICRLLIFPLRVRFSVDLHRLAASRFPLLVSVSWIQGASFPLSVFLIDSEQRASPSVPAQRSCRLVLLSRSGVSSHVDLRSDLFLCEFCSGSISRSARTRVRSDFGFGRRCRSPTLLGLPPDFIAVSFAAALVLCSIFGPLSEERPYRSILAHPVRSLSKGVFRFSAGRPRVSRCDFWSSSSISVLGFTAALGRSVATGSFCSAP
jgi:hypothetical protein